MDKPEWKNFLDQRIRAAKVGLSKPGNEDNRLMDSKGLYSTKTKDLLIDVENLSEVIEELSKALYEIKGHALALDAKGLAISGIANHALGLYDQGSIEPQTQNLNKFKRSFK